MKNGTISGRSSTVERDVANVEVVGSNPIVRSRRKKMEDKTICYECGTVIAETKCSKCKTAMCLDCGRKYIPKEIFEQWFGEDE